MRQGGGQTLRYVVEGVVVAGTKQAVAELHMTRKLINQANCALYYSKH